jgi:hypothetical protein
MAKHGIVKEDKNPVELGRCSLLTDTLQACVSNAFFLKLALLAGFVGKNTHLRN